MNGDRVLLDEVSAQIKVGKSVPSARTPKRISEHRRGFATLRLGGDEHDRAFFYNNRVELNALLQQWGQMCFEHYGADDIYLSSSSAINAAICDMVSRQRSGWPAEARDLCALLERKIYEFLRSLDEINGERDRLASENKALKSQAEHLAKALRHAEATAEEVKARLRGVDPSRIRREVEAELAQRTASVADENRSLKASLHEAQSQVAKLAEDKKRLRAALNTRSGK